MTTTASSTERHVEAICPPFCAGHSATGYQGWESFGDGHEIRDHAEAGTMVGDVHVMAVQRENDDHSVEPSIVAIYVERDGTDMTPADAREVAALLIAAADRAEARQ